MHLEDLIQRIDQLIEKADEVIQTKEVRLTGTSDPIQTYVNEGLFHAFRSASLSFLAMTFGKEHIHYVEFNSEANQPKLHCAEIGRGILSVAREELAGGWLTTTKGLISSKWRSICSMKDTKIPLRLWPVAFWKSICGSFARNTASQRKRPNRAARNPRKQIDSMQTLPKNRCTTSLTISR